MPNAPAAAITGTTPIQWRSIQPRFRATPKDHRRRPARDAATDDSPANRLDDEPHGVGARRLARVSLRDRDCDREQWDAEAVVQPTLDVQPLADSRRDVLVGDHGLTERSVGRGEDHRQHERVSPGDVGQHDRPGDRSRPDRQREPDAEETRRKSRSPSATHEGRCATRP